MNKVCIDQGTQMFDLLSESAYRSQPLGHSISQFTWDHDYRCKGTTWRSRVTSARPQWPWYIGPLSSRQGRPNGPSPPILLPTQGTGAALPLGPCHLHSGRDKMSSGRVRRRSCLQVPLSPKNCLAMTIFIRDYQLSAFPYRLGLCLSLHQVHDKLLWMATKSKVQAS